MPDVPAELPRPDGKARDWDEETLAALALLIYASRERASALWDRLAPQHRGLLGATAYPTVADAVTAGVTTFWFARNTQQYGRGSAVIPQSNLAAAWNGVINASSAQANAYAQQMATGAVPLAEWQQGSADRLTGLILLFLAFGSGGVNNTSAEAMDAGRDKLAGQLRYLTRFAGQVEAGAVTADTVTFIARRAGYYAEDASTVTETARRIAHLAEGFTEERNILHAAEHCQGSRSCVEQTGRGWVPIGALIDIGRRLCSFRCRCSLEFR